MATPQTASRRDSTILAPASKTPGVWRAQNLAPRRGATLPTMASTYLSLNVHIVFATKGRAPMIVSDWRDALHAYIAGTVRDLGASAYAVGGVADHVHILAAIKSTHCVADLVRETKKASRAWARERYDRFSWP